MSLRKKIILLLVPIIVTPMIISGWMSYSFLKATIIEKSQEQMETLLEQYALYADSLIHDSESNVKLFSHNEMLRRYMVTPSEEERYEILQPLLMKQFQNYQKAYPDYYEFRLIFPDGMEDLRLVNRSVENKFMDEAANPFIKKLLNQKKGTFSRVMRNPDNNQFAMYVATALVLKDRTLESNSSIPRFRGYLVVTIDISEMIQQMELSKLGSDGLIFLSDNDGMAQLSANRFEEALSKNYLSSQQLQQLEIADEITDVVGGRINLVDTPLINTRFMGTQGFMRAIKIHDDFVLVTWLPGTDTSAKTQELATIVISLTLLTIVITTVLIFSSLNYFVLSPIQKLRSAANEIGNGVLNKPLQMIQGDEIGELADSFDDMRKKMLSSHEHLEKQVDERTREVRMALEAAEKSSEEKSKFLSRMSHELRTPLNAIIGYSHLFGFDANLTEHQKKNVKEINAAGEHLLSLINEVLDLSRIESGSLSLQSEPIYLGKVIATCCVMSEPLAKASNVTLHFEMNACKDVYVLADYTRLKQVLLNLISNGVKYNRHNGRVDISCMHTENGFIRINIEDTGPGISQNNINQLFEPFNRLGAEYSNTEGTGIGLMITAQLVELMGGYIGVDSELDKGSTFWVELGETESSILSSGVEFQDYIHAENDIHDIVQDNVRILVAEDNEANQEVLNQQLEVLGYQADFVDDGIEALDKLNAQDYSILLTDIHMPKMGGMELVKALRDSDEEKHSGLKVIAITADAMERQVQECIDAGMDDHIPKPVHLDELSRKLNYWLSINKEATEAKEDTAQPGTEQTTAEVITLNTLTEKPVKKRILVAEDNEANLELLELQLEMLGHEADYAVDGMEAYELWEAGDYDLLLTDIHMPGMNGYELVKKIRATQRYKDSDMKIVAVSADAKDSLVKGCEEVGLDDYITKPVFVKVLEEKLARWLPEQESAGEDEPQPPISMPELKQIVGSDPDIILRLLHKFILTSADTVEEIRNAFEQQDDEGTAGYTHKLKGAARSMGAIQLGDTCQGIENALHEQNAEKVEELVTLVEEQFEEIKLFVEQEFTK